MKNVLEIQYPGSKKLNIIIGFSPYSFSYNDLFNDLLFWL